MFSGNNSSIFYHTRRVDFRTTITPPSVFAGPKLSPDIDIWLNLAESDSVNAVLAIFRAILDSGRKHSSRIHLQARTKGGFLWQPEDTPQETTALCLQDMQALAMDLKTRGVVVLDSEGRRCQRDWGAARRTDGNQTTPQVL
jgi:hypothetical protein